ncbi:protein-arginine N5-methyltransferase [Aureococcus anophagefferens]|nr:protein-arginine N5-methyltransferase [Aureococcus anophagefferens]
MHALAFLAVATTIVVGGGEDAAATVADGGACGNGRVIPDDRELELFHTVTDHGAWRGATFESTDEVLRFRGEVVMAADETVYYVVLEPNRGVFDAALGLALETAASASPFLGFWEENAAPPVEEHVIVEANAAVLRALLASDLGARSGVKALLGFWQEVVPLLRAESFDAVFFDPFPNDLERLGGACAHQRGFMAEAFRVLRPGGVFVAVRLLRGVRRGGHRRRARRGLPPGDVDITVDYPMVDYLCAEYPNCAHFDHPCS